MEKINQKLSCFVFGNVCMIVPLFMAGLLLLFSSTPVCAAVTVISDEETELYLQNLSEPIFNAAAIPFNRHKVFILENNSLNAFVSDGNNLFIHSETLLKINTDDELRGILAHEVGHIQGGHLLRHKLKMQEMKNITLASMAAAMALGMASGRGDVAIATALGAQSSLLNQSFVYQIQEERNADESAVSLLNKTGHSPQGLLNFMKKIQLQNKLQGIQETPYYRTHPMSAERLAFLRQAVQNSVFTPQKQKSETLKRIQAKLYAFIKSPQQTYLKYPTSDTSISALYARTIATFKSLQFKKALSSVDLLIKQEPKNPYFHELKGQILFESGNIEGALQQFKLASNILPSSALFKMNEAQALLELSPSPKELRSIITKLRQALASKPNTIGWLLLAKAHHLSHNEAEAKYASAYYNLQTGDLKLAEKQAQEAKQLSKKSQLNLKIDDLLQTIKIMQKSF